MEALSVVKSDEVPDSRPEFSDVSVFFDIDLLVFECAEESFDGDVVDASSFAVHRNGDSMFLKQSGMLFARILAVLIRIEDLRRPIAFQRLLQDTGDQIRIHRIGELP